MELFRGKSGSDEPGEGRWGARGDPRGAEVVISRRDSDGIRGRERGRDRGEEREACAAVAGKPE
jgi:hypothetical protein